VVTLEPPLLGQMVDEVGCSGRSGGLNTKMSHRDTKIERRIKLYHTFSQRVGRSGTIRRRRKILVGGWAGYGKNREACMALGGDGGLRMRG